jgi:hypothetical protein
MIELHEDDFRSLESFSQAGRWTGRNLLPPTVLSGIRPLVPAKAREVFSETLLFDPDNRFLPGHYQIVEIETGNEDVQQVGDWLRQHIANLEEHVVVSWAWEPEEAVATTGAIFCDYWDDFCYPSSDDVVITPLSQDWKLVYWHEEVFFFGRRYAQSVRKQSLVKNG